MNGKVSRWFVAAFAAAMCPLFAVADGGLADGYAKMVSIRVSDSLVAENVTLTDFPVLVRLGSNISGFSYDDFALLNDAVKKGDVLATLYTSKEDSLKEAERMYRDALTIGKDAPKDKPLVYARVEKDKVERY